MTWVGGFGRGAGVPRSEVILAPAHGFDDATPPGPISRVGGAWVASRADNAVNAEVQVWREEVIDAGRLRIIEVSGVAVTLPPFDDLGAAIVADEFYFVSTAAPVAGGAGKLSRFDSNFVAGEISKPIVLTRLDGGGNLIGHLQWLRGATVSQFIEGANPLGLYVPDPANWLEAKDFDAGPTASIRTSVLASAYEGRAFKFTGTDVGGLNVQGKIRQFDDDGVQLTGDIIWGARIGVRRLLKRMDVISTTTWSFDAGIVSGLTIHDSVLLGAGVRSVSTNEPNSLSSGFFAPDWQTEGIVGGSSVVVGLITQDVLISRIAGTVSVYTGRPGDALAQLFTDIVGQGTGDALLSLRNIRAANAGHGVECLLLGERLYDTLPL